MAIELIIDTLPALWILSKRLKKGQLTKKVIHSFSEICLNILHGNIPINISQKQKFQKYKNYIRKLIRRNTNLEEKRRIILKIEPIFKDILSIITHIVNEQVQEDETSSHWGQSTI